MAKKASPNERALWTFLIATLAGPFLAAVVVLAGGAAFSVLGKWLPPGVAALDMAGRMRWAGEHAVMAFVWSAWPAALGGAAAAGLILWRDRLGWLDCAIAGAVSAALFAFLSGGAVVRHMMPIAFLGAAIGAAMWSVLMRARIVRE